MIKFLDLGNHPPPLNFVKNDDKKKLQKKFPLQVFYCKSCGLVQLGNAVDPNIMFKEYVYTSGVSTAFKNHLRSFTDLLVKRFDLTSKDLVIDIASNDGTLLDGFVPFGVKVLGVEPSNVAKIAIQNGIPTINDFFNEETAKKILKESGQAKIITAANVFAHVDKLSSFMDGIKLLLKDNGVYVSESQYLVDIIEKLEYDTIYHEHLRYYTLKQLIHLFEKHEMDVFDAERISAQGGSIRVYACHKGKFNITNSVQQILREEDKSKISS
ncbi:MAG: methyltransferase domain-containing protein, partial [Patescibacteria group bacterium]|nr:methyltransferase domain-containing protein [Patescibacteria group bacterium]